MTPVLTPREHEVMAGIATGQSELEVAQGLGVSRHTIARHVVNVSEKCGGGGRIRSFFALGWLRIPVVGMTLTPREYEVATRFALGQTWEQIQAEMHLAHKTVRFHRASVIAKAGGGCLLDALRALGWLQVPAEPQPINRVRRSWSATRRGFS